MRWRIINRTRESSSGAPSRTIRSSVTVASLQFRSVLKLKPKRLLPQFDQRGALASFILRGFSNSGHVGMRLEEVADATAEDAGAVAVNDAHARESGQEGAIEIFLEFFGGFVDSAADEVDLHAHVVGVGAGDGDMDALLLAGCGQGIRFALSTRGRNWGAVVAFDAHLDGAESYFKYVFLDFTLHDGDFVHGLDANLV